jgi:hypothetical protein
VSLISSKLKTGPNHALSILSFVSPALSAITTAPSLALSLTLSAASATTSAAFAMFFSVLQISLP